MRILYLIGGPGTGKSTLMQTLTAGAVRAPQTRSALPHELLRFPGHDAPTGAELGIRRPDFPGTDTLSMSINPTAVSSLTDGTWNGLHTLYGEGDRLANTAFLSAAHKHHQLHVVYLRTDPRTVLERCASRGSTQDVSWLRGRITKAERLAGRLDSAGIRVQELDTSEPVKRLAERIRRSFGDPND